MNIALIGNCQLQQVGHYMQRIDSKCLNVTWYMPPFSFDKSTSIVNFYKALEASDKIYCQYYDYRWGDLSTENIGKFFDLSIVPTLDSVISSPQIGHLDLENSYSLYDIDFRILHLFLSGFNWSEAILHYHNHEFDLDKLLISTNALINKYKKLFIDSKVIADYSDFYESSLIKNGPSIFYTHNHPNNDHLQWLADVILNDAIKMTSFIFEGIEDVLTDTVPPVVGSGNFSYILKGQSVGLKTASKIYYTLFNQFDRLYLKNTLLNSTYNIFSKS